LDGIDELLVALHDIGQILSRPALARLAKIEQVAEEVAGTAPPPHRRAQEVSAARGRGDPATVSRPSTVVRPSS
jgi:hypothetical protein